jgi:hypothetical protein
LQVPGLSTEVNILSRLLHRSINQHRSSKHLARMRQLRRLVKQTVVLGVDQLLTRTSLLCVRALARLLLLMQSHACMQLQRSGSSCGVTSLPSQHLLCHVMLKLLSFYSLVVRLQQHCLACTAPLAQLISQTYFMPFALTANAIVARIFSITSDMLPAIARAWTLMTVALARAPPHSSPSPESAELLCRALPCISAPIACVHVAAVQQLGSGSASSSNVKSVLAADPQPHAHADAAQTRAPSDVDCLDDVGVPLGSGKTGMVSKLLRRQKRKLEPASPVALL